MSIGWLQHTNVVSSRKRCLYFQFIRFWGKVLGTMKNYYVAEVEFGDGDYESELDEDEEFGSELNNMVKTKKCLVVLINGPSQSGSSGVVLPVTRIVSVLVLSSINVQLAKIKKNHFFCAIIWRFFSAK